MPNSFEFKNVIASPDQGRFEFTYQLKTSNTTYDFSEVIELPQPVTREVPVPVLTSILQMLHLVLGISYWKTYWPKHIEVKSHTLSTAQASFWNTLYTQGLGEFYFKNNIDFRGLVTFPSDESVTSSPADLQQQSRSLVGLGGGKDSLVVAQLLKDHGKAFDTFIVETQHAYGFIDELNSNLIKEPLVVKRSIDPKLIELNTHPDTYNGHIPISAIYGAIGILLCVVYDYSSVVVGNERSSNVGNTTFHGEEINHQWSKSQAFETLFQEFIHSSISPQLSYLSLLRPLSEMQVMKMFVKTSEFLPLFSSCNRNFSITHQLHNSKWCGDCPKCAFVFALLAAFVSKERAVTTFGQNLFTKKSLLSTYQELWGEKGVKPFECVGTPTEVKLAFARAHKKEEYENDVIMQYFIKHIVPGTNIAELEHDVMNSDGITRLEEIITTL